MVLIFENGTRGQKDMEDPVLAFLTLFYMGFWRYVNTWGGQIDPPPLLKARKMIETW